MRPEADVRSEVWVLTTPAGQALLAEVAAVVAPRPADVGRWRRQAGPVQVAAALRLADARRRGAAKFERADRMWLDPVGLEQATAEAVSRHKARRFAGRAEVVFDLCCGIGGDAIALALAAGARVIAVDRDQAMCRRTRWNASVHEVGASLAVVRADVRSFVIPSGAWVHVDPDRRAGQPAGRRARRLEGYEPGPDVLFALAGQAPGGAIKLGPASDFDDHFSGPGFEVELISLSGECKEATVWFGEAVSCRRRATCLPNGATWTDRDAPAAIAPVGPVEAWVYDPDPSLARAGLLDAFAAAHGLGRYTGGVDFLTSRELVASPFLAAFEVIEVLPLDLKRVKAAVGSHGLGRLEVKTRGLDLPAEALRARLQHGQGGPGSLLLSGGLGPSRAVLARRAPVRS